MPFFTFALQVPDNGKRSCAELMSPYPSNKGGMSDKDWELVCDCKSRQRTGFLAGFLVSAVALDRVVGFAFPAAYRFGGLLAIGTGAGLYTASRRMWNRKLDLEEDSKLEEFMYPRYRSGH
mmetsp:Transcript_1682/g.2285  ORF Transcript_1682/g.2285 Transcript_1682/m.2285 type:complete len:121 (-) Transcript_1682:75-437(-)